jgi:flavin-dependent dehydrogenase
VVEEEVVLVELRFRYGDAVVRRAREPAILMTQRRRLDAFLLDAARERGVEVREGTTVQIDPGYNLSLAGGERVAAAVVVGADGANGTTAKAVGLGQGIVHGVAYEGNASYERLDRRRYEHRAVVELADIPGGYGWVFPKGDHANVGVGAWQQAGPQLRAHLERLCAAHGLDAGEAALLVRGGELSLQEPLDRAPDELAAREPPRRARPAVERLLELPRGAMQRREVGVDGRLVGCERRHPPAEQVEDRLRRQP